MGHALAIIPLLLAMPEFGAAPAGNAGKSESCVSDTGLSSPIATEDGQLMFRGEPSSHPSYIGVFRGGRCPGARADSTVIIERFGAQYCRGDHVRFKGWDQTIPGPVCIIDHFEPYTPPAPAARTGR